MDVIQAKDYVNLATAEVLGETGIVNEDLSNLVDVGNEILNNRKVDAFVRSLVNHIGKVIVVDRMYQGTAPNILREDWEYGSIVQKIRSKMPTATINENWELVDGESYDGTVFHGSDVSSKFWDDGLAFEFDQSITEDVVKQSFSNGQQLSSFINMLFNNVRKAQTIATEKLVRATINRFMAETLYSFAPDGNYSGKTSDRVRNLYYEYTLENPDTTLTAVTCWKDPDFQRFAAQEWLIGIDNLRGMFEGYNVGGVDTFTPKEYLNVLMLTRFKKMAEMHLGADTFHNELVALPGATEVPYWQGPGKASEDNHNLSHTQADISKIDITIENGVEVECSGIIGCMFDREALGIWQEDIRVDTEWVAKGGFTNYFHKLFMRCWNDLNENFVMFITA